MNRKKAPVSFVIVAMLLCSPLILPVRATPSDWSKPRPSIGTIYDETIGNSKTDDVASIDMGVHIYQYVEGVSDQDDFLKFKISASANTRVGIQYEVLEEDYYWCEVSEPTGITDDNSGAWLDLGFTFLYYGVEYERVWVCSNGFLTLNKTCTNADPQSIPSTSEPNPVIAVFWRDLHLEWGGSITYGRDVYFNGAYYLVVSWNNVPDDNGDPQTFQVLIQQRQGYGSEDFHNVIFFQYKSITKTYPTTVGTEDQVGNKGTAYDYNNLHNEACLRFDYFIAGYRLERLKIKLTKSDGYAKIDFLRTYIGGYNIIIKEYANPFGDTFKAAIETAASLALLKAGIMWNVMLITAEFAGVLASDLSRPYTDEEHVKDAWEDDNEAWAWAQCMIENRSLSPFDSTLATTVVWSFTDENDRDHFLTVTAEAWYRDLSNGNLYTISTSSTLNMYINSPPNTPSKPSGTTSGYVYTTYSYSTSTTDPDGDKVKYQFSWGDGSYSTTGYYSSGVTVYASHSWSSTGYKYVKVRAYDGYVWSDWSPSLTVYISSGGGGGGGEPPCPTLFVWNGTGYVDYGVINIHDPSGEDVIQEVYVLAVDVEINNYKATFRLREGWPGLEFSESDIDQVKLYAVDSDGNHHLCPLIKAIHEEQGNVLLKLLLSDDYKVKITLLETTDLTFIVPYPNVQDFIFVIEGNNMLKP